MVADPGRPRSLGTQSSAFRAAWAIVAGSFACALLAVLLVARGGPATGVFQIPGGPGGVVAAIGVGVGLLTFPVVGAVIATHRPEHWIGWLFLGSGAVLSFSNLAGVYSYHALDTNPGSLPGGAALAVVADSLWLPGLALTSVFLFLLFPSGRLQGTAERVTGVVALLGVVLSLLGGLTEPALYSARQIPNPLPFAGPGLVSSALLLLGFTLVLGCVAPSAIILVRRFRRSRGDERQQMKWFVFSAVLVLLFFVPTNLMGSAPVVIQLLAGASAIALPISVGVALLKYRLYDIDVVVNKALVYGALALFVTAVYVAGVVLVGGLTTQGLVPSMLATAIVAALFQPLRERVQRVANRIVYGQRASPYEVLASFSDRVAGTYATEDVLPRTARVIAEGTGAERAEVWLRVGEELRLSAVWPNRDGEVRSVPIDDTQEVPSLGDVDRAVPVRSRNELLGAVTVTASAGEPLTPSDLELLDGLARQAGLVLSNVRLTAELEARLEQISAQASELRASRQRIVAAQDDERRRLERNIHDGAQQHLVALAVKLRLARAVVQRNQPEARSMLRELRDEVGEAIDTLGALTLGIYPPLLEEQGLAAALAAQYQRSRLPVRLSVEGSRRYPIETEAALYFCVLEALQNAAKHARATSIRVRISEQGGGLSFEVVDDGVGFDADNDPRGSGLQNMLDRLSTLGGTLAIGSTPGRGTTIGGWVPLPIREVAR